MTSRLRIIVPVLALLLGMAALTAAEKDEMKVDLVLLWGTNDDPAKHKDLKEADPGLSKHLRAFKWKNYLVINRKTVSLPEKKEQKIDISKDCKLMITDLGDSKLKVKLFGKGEWVFDRTQTIKPGGSAVFGGDDKNDTAWFIFVTRQKGK